MPPQNKNRANHPKGRVWRKPIVSKDIDIAEIGHLLQEIHYKVGQTAQTPKDHLSPKPFGYLPKGNEIKVHKYKKVEDKIRPIPTIMPEDVKVKRTIPADPLKTLPILPTHAPGFIPTTRITQERLDTLLIDENPDILEEEKRLLKHVLMLNSRSIAFEEKERGTFRQDYFTNYQIPVIAHVPWMDKNIPLPPGHRDEIIRMLKEKMDGGVYEKAQSSYRSRWFCVQKKTGDLRIVHDLQKLNGVTIRETGVPPILDEFVEAYAGRSIYTVLDMYWGFYARTLDPKSRDMTAFQTPLGVLRITSLPMGFTNSPAEFQACMVFLLEDEIPEVAGVFIDDIPIKGPVSRYQDENGEEERMAENPGIRRFIWEHLNDLHRVLHRIGEAGGTVSGKKMQLCRTNVEIVGQRCSRDGRMPTDTRAQRIRDWPTPINVTEVRGFMGLCGTVRIWIKDYSRLARPLVDLTRKDTEFSWGPPQVEAFQLLKTLVSQAPALRPIDYRSERPVFLSVDTSIYGIGFVLSQDDEKGRRVPARYGSLPLSDVESSYSQAKLELFGLFRALRQYELYLAGISKLVVEVDASYIKGMLKNPQPGGKGPENRWIRGILLFYFDLVHIPGHKHKAPDALSRRRYTRADDENPGPYPKEFLLPNDTTAFPQELTREGNQSVRVLMIQQTGKEQDIQNILTFLNTSKPPLGQSPKQRQRFLSKVARYYLTGDKLYRRHTSGNDQRVLIARESREKILKEIHDELGHRGEWPVWETIRIRFYWPGMRRDVTCYVKSCHDCQLRSTKKMHIPITVSQPTGLFGKVYLDVMKMPLAKGKNWIVACRDDISWIAEGRALASDNGRALASFFVEEIIFRYGTVGIVVTDNGPSLGGEFTRIVNKYNVTQIKISPYNSQANGVVERGHFTLREALVKMCKGDLSKWPSLLPAALFADRITVRRATGFSPYYLLHGVHPTLPCDLAEATFMVPQKENLSDVELLTARIRQIAKMPEDLARARDTLIKSRFRSKEAFEKKFGQRVRRTSYQKAELVLMRNNKLDKTVSIDRKVLDRYMGPYRVVRETRGQAYVLEELNGNVLRTPVAAFRLIPYIKREQLDGWARLVEAWDGNHSDGSDQSQSEDETGTDGSE